MNTLRLGKNWNLGWRRRLGPKVLAGLAVVALLLVAAPWVQAATQLAPVSLSGGAESPGPGDPDGTGTAAVTLVPAESQVCYTLWAANISPATAAHIHIAPAGQPGPVVVPLNAPTTGSSYGCVTVVPELLDAIAADPAAYYVNVHNADYPDGAVRGQLAP